MARIQLKDHYYEGEVNEKGEPHGYGIEYHDDGIIFKGTYINGKRNGPSVIYYAPNYYREVNYTDGKPNGHSMWYRDGKLVIEGDYLNGKMSGYWIYIVGNLRSEGTYVNDLENGVWVTIGLDDGSVSEDEYRDGNKNGPSIYTTREGYCTAGEYCDDLEIGHWIDYFPDGSHQDGYYVKGRQEGIWTTYMPDGDITKERYHKGHLKGRIDVITKEGDEISVGFRNGLFRFKGKSSDGVKFDMKMNEDGNGSAYIEDNDGTKVSGAYHDGKEYGRWSVSDKDGFAEMDLTGGNVNSSEYKEKKKGFFSRLFGKK